MGKRVSSLPAYPVKRFYVKHPPHRQGPESRAGKCMAIGPVAVSGGGSRKWISVRVFTLTAEEWSPPWQCIYGRIANQGRG